MAESKEVDQIFTYKITLYFNTVGTQVPIICAHVTYKFDCLNTTSFQKADSAIWILLP